MHFYSPVSLSLSLSQPSLFNFVFLLLLLCCLAIAVVGSKTACLLYDLLLVFVKISIKLYNEKKQTT